MLLKYIKVGFKMSRDVSKNRNVGFYINGGMDRLDNAYYELFTL